MTHFFLSFSATLLLALPFSLQGAQTRPSLNDAPRLERDADRVIRRYSRGGGFSGVVLIARGKEILFKRAYGNADEEKKTPNTIETRFAIGSLTKQFTAAAILQLEQGGRLSVEDELGKHLPDVPKALSKIRLKHLLGHTSGIRDYMDLKNADSLLHMDSPLSAVFSELGNSKPLFKSGNRFKYSNTNYAILGTIVERVSGENFEGYLTKHLFTPAGMGATGVFKPTRAPEKMAMGHCPRGGPAPHKMPIDELEDLSRIPGDGSLFSTAEDLHRWDLALRGTQLLSAASLVKMGKPGMGNYGMGVSIKKICGNKALTHAGAVRGFRAALYRFPDTPALVILLSNQEEIPEKQIAHSLSKTLLCSR